MSSVRLAVLDLAYAIGQNKGRQNHNNKKQYDKQYRVHVSFQLNRRGKIKDDFPRMVKYVTGVNIKWEKTLFRDKNAYLGTFDRNLLSLSRHFWYHFHEQIKQYHRIGSEYDPSLAGCSHIRADLHGLLQAVWNIRNSADGECVIHLQHDHSFLHHPRVHINHKRMAVSFRQIQEPFQRRISAVVHS